MFFAIPKPARSFVKQYMAYYIHIVCLFVYSHSTVWGLTTSPWNALSFFTWTLLHRTQVCQHRDYELAFTPNLDVRKQQKHRNNFNGNNPLSPKSDDDSFAIYLFNAHFRNFSFRYFFLCSKQLVTQYHLSP